MNNFYAYISFIVFIVFYSCESNTYDDIAPKINLAADLVSYSREIKPIIEANCVVCHYQNSPAAPFSLTTYLEVKNKTEFGTLIERIETATGILSMPRNGQKLSTTQIQIIKLWASQGFKN